MNFTNEEMEELKQAVQEHEISVSGHFPVLYLSDYNNSIILFTFDGSIWHYRHALGSTSTCLVQFIKLIWQNKIFKNQLENAERLIAQLKQDTITAITVKQ